MRTRVRVTKSRLLTFIYVAIIMVGVTKTYIEESIDVSSLPVNKKHIVIDAGHGGWDPGKVIDNGEKEKNVNLAIAKKLQGYLEQGGAIISPTRVEDEALSENKREDLKDRKKLGQNEDVDLFISIHQNAFPKESVKGAQVFYYKNSEEGKKLAESIQARLKEVVDIDNTRVPKPNNEYYLLKDTKVPSVIVECGFLSNGEEYKNLMDGKYQEKVAWAIYMGILDFYEAMAV